MPKNILKLSYTLAICILLTVLFTSYWAVRQSLATKENDAKIINVAGRQRMLSQKITQLALRLVATNDTVQKKSISFQLQKTLALWQQSHNALKFGNVQFNISQPENNEPILFQLNELEKTLNSIVQSCNSILQNEKSKEEALNTIIKNQDIFLPSMDAVVKAYEKKSDEKLQFTKNLQTGLLLLSLLV
ncbi:MAG: type IV pili methyl-accepting chemotaxis transducer N-terminal domain-containing protein [Chitinophagaceae bacterium]